AQSSSPTERIVAEVPLRDPERGLESGGGLAALSLEGEPASRVRGPEPDAGGMNVSWHRQRQRVSRVSDHARSGIGRSIATGLAVLASYTALVVWLTWPLASLIDTPPAAADHARAPRGPIPYVFPPDPTIDRGTEARAWVDIAIPGRRTDLQLIVADAN